MGLIVFEFIVFGCFEMTDEYNAEQIRKELLNGHSELLDSAFRSASEEQNAQIFNSLGKMPDGSKLYHLALNQLREFINEGGKPNIIYWFSLTAREPRCEVCYLTMPSYDSLHCLEPECKNRHGMKNQHCKAPGCPYHGLEHRSHCGECGKHHHGYIHCEQEGCSLLVNPEILRKEDLLHCTKCGRHGHVATNHCGICNIIGMCTPGAVHCPICGSSRCPGDERHCNFIDKDGERCRGVRYYGPCDSDGGWNESDSGSGSGSTSDDVDTSMCFDHQGEQQLGGLLD